MSFFEIKIKVLKTTFTFLNNLFTPILICFFKKSIYYHKEKFPYNIFNKKKLLFGQME